MSQRLSGICEQFLSLFARQPVQFILTFGFTEIEL